MAETNQDSGKLTLNPASYTPTGKLLKLLNEKKSGREFQSRKHPDWNENYELYRNKVKTNRLTQRQTVNVPLMKETIKTLLSKVDDAPDVAWQEKSGDEMKEIIYQEVWNDGYKNENLETKDIIDKKNVFLYGLSTKTLNLTSKGVCVNVEDPFNIIFDPLMNPLDIETARFIIQQNIFRPLRDVLVDERYTTTGRDALRHWLASDRGLIQSAKNKVEFEKSIERLKAMGVQNENFGVFAGGDVLVNLTQHFTQLWDDKTKSFKRHVVVYGDDTIELMDDLLVDCVGIEEWPMDVWYEDPEGNDPYPDGIADLVRTPNKVLNVWFSQQVENRTLQNFQMHWFDATVQGYQPQTYEPGPGRMLPAPGDPNKTIMPVQVNGLDETMKAMDYLIQMVERGTGATALEKGEQTTNARTTLGEVELLAGKAAERAKTMSKFYKASWYRLAKKWDKIMQANSFPKMKLYKTGIDGKVYEKIVYNVDWKSKAGYEPTVESSSEQEQDDIKTIQKFGFVIAQNPNNKALKRIAQKRQLKVLDLTAPELKEVEEEEVKLQQQEALAAATAATPATDTKTAATPASPAAATPAAPETGDAQEVASMLQQLVN
jgi:hypothetical protein